MGFGREAPDNGKWQVASGKLFGADDPACIINHFPSPIALHPSAIGSFEQTLGTRDAVILGEKTIKALLADPPGRDWHSFSGIAGRNAG
jgi:hypothetical protein